MALNTGVILNNRYRIVRLVGQGGFGAVYRAWDLSLGQPVALKENVDAGAESQRQFEREAKLLAGLRHPNLPVVIDHFIIPGQGQYLVMDFVEGKSLHALLAERGGRLPEPEVLPWVRQVCDALTYLHTRTPPIIHRDIKPDNIILTGDGRAMLVDFGISKVYDPGGSTTVGAKAVTPGYSPPEQYGAGKTDARSDIYALGATLYTLLTGRVPPDAPDLSSGTEALPPLREANPAVSASVSRAVEAAMATTVSQRLPTAAAFAEALSARAVASSPPATMARTGALGAGAGGGARKGLPRAALIGGALVLVALLAWGGFALGRRGAATNEPEPTAPESAIANGQEATPVETPPAQFTPAATQAASSPTAAPATATTELTAAPTDAATATPLSQILDSRLVILPGGVQAEQVYVPAGSFMMGTETGAGNERPAHRVTLDAFWLDQTEVTNAQFAAFVDDTGFETAAEREGAGVGFTADGWGAIAGANWQHPHGPDSDIIDLDDHPVVQVSWDDATAYCAWAGGRLPTEAQWEYAARGPDGRVYPWGDTFDRERLNYCDSNCFLDVADQEADDGYMFTAPVGSFPDGASWVGALDMAGNAWEWVNDWYGVNYYRDAPASNPTGPETGEQRVLRGGSWDDFDYNLRSAFRYFYLPFYRYNYVGFRCVYD